MTYAQAAARSPSVPRSETGLESGERELPDSTDKLGVELSTVLSKKARLPAPPVSLMNTA